MPADTGCPAYPAGVPVTHRICSCGTRRATGKSRLCHALYQPRRVHGCRVHPLILSIFLTGITAAAVSIRLFAAAKKEQTGPGDMSDDGCGTEGFQV